MLFCVYREVVCKSRYGKYIETRIKETNMNDNREYGRYIMYDFNRKSPWISFEEL